MNTPTAEYFFQIVRRGEVVRTGLSEVRLVDDDLIRGNDDIEIRSNDDFDLPLFNGFTRFVPTGPNLDDIERVFDDGEVVTEVVFNDGSTLTDVLGLLSPSSGVGGTSQRFLLDQNALEAAGKSYSDIAQVNIIDFVEHDLSFADLGFDVPDTGPTDDPVPDPGLNQIVGTGGRDRLEGTSENDAIDGGAGNDRLYGRDGDDILNGGADNDRLFGGNGADTFVFGDADTDGDRDFDRIFDFDASKDTIVLEDGASIRRVVESRGDVIIELNGDRDQIRVENADRSIVDHIVFIDGDFIA